MERYLFDDKELVAFNGNKGEFVVSHIPAMLFSLSADTKYDSKFV